MAATAARTKAASGDWHDSLAAAELTPFRTAVYDVTCLLPAGRVATYGTVAALLDCRSAQAVGTALHHNPFAPTVPCHRIVRGGSGGSGSSSGSVPCHRVVRGGATLGGFCGSKQESGHADIRRKADILAAEGVAFEGDAMRLADAASEWLPDDFPAAAVNKIRARLGLPPRVAAGSSVAVAEADEATVSGSKRGRGRLATMKGAAAAAAGSADDACCVKPAAAASGSGPRAALSAPGASGRDVRAACRDGTLGGHTSGLAPGYAQANLVILPREHAYDFLLFCVRNPKPCPLLEVTDLGSPEAVAMAPGSDIRTDLPRYRVYHHGVMTEEVTDVRHLWPDAPAADAGSAPAPKRSRSGASTAAAAAAASAPPPPAADARTDWVGFLLGCSFSFEEALLDAGVPVRHLQEERSGRVAPTLAVDAQNVPMYRTAVPTAPAGVFSGPLVVSMRPMSATAAATATEVTARFPRVHGKYVIVSILRVRGGVPPYSCHPPVSPHHRTLQAGICGPRQGHRHRQHCQARLWRRRHHPEGCVRLLVHRRHTFTPSTPNLPHPHTHQVRSPCFGRAA